LPCGSIPLSPTRFLDDCFCDKYVEASRCCGSCTSRDSTATWSGVAISTKVSSKDGNLAQFDPNANFSARIGQTGSLNGRLVSGGRWGLVGVGYSGDFVENLFSVNQIRFTFLPSKLKNHLLRPAYRDPFAMEDAV